MSPTIRLVSVILGLANHINKSVLVQLLNYFIKYYNCPPLVLFFYTTQYLSIDDILYSIETCLCIMSMSHTIPQVNIWISRERKKKKKLCRKIYIKFNYSKSLWLLVDSIDYNVVVYIYIGVFTVWLAVWTEPKSKIWFEP